MPALLLTDGGGTSFKLDRDDDTSMYLVFGDAVLGHNTARNLSAAVAQGLPNRGSVLGTRTVYDCFCAQVLTPVAPFVEIWLVYSTNHVSGSLGYRRSSRVDTKWQHITIPNWTKHTPSVGMPYYVAVPLENRLHATRIEVTVEKWIQTSGITENDIESFDVLNAGGWVSRGGNIFQYLGSCLRTGADNQQTVIVKYRSKSGLPGIAVGTYAGYDVAVPDLPPMCEYLPREPASPSSPGVIEVIAPDVQYFPATVPPWDT